MSERADEPALENEAALTTEETAQGWDCHVHVFHGSVPVHGAHYQPVHRPLEAIEAVAQAHGVSHLVLVQPSVYGTDNRLMLQALARTPGRHRGVVVLDDAVSDAELETMHALGVRGARLNGVSPVGEQRPAAERFAALAPRLRRCGWHLQWYAAAAQLETIAQLHAGSGVTCVLDHLGGLHAALPADDPAWRAVALLAAEGAWLKLSGWYRLHSSAPYTDLLPTIQRLARLFGSRLLWGSDWPHTAFAADALPPYASTWAPVVEALGVKDAQALRVRVPEVYG